MSLLPTTHVGTKAVSIAALADSLASVWHIRPFIRLPLVALQPPYPLMHLYDLEVSVF